MKTLFQILAILFSTLFYSQTTAEKLKFIVKTNGSVEHYKYMILEMTLKPLKNNLNKSDSLTLIQIENKLTDEDISQRLSKGFAEVFTGKEINDIYNFYHTSAGKKYLNSNEILELQNQKQFKDVQDELKLIIAKNNFMNKDNAPKSFEENIVAPVYADREDGFYSVLNATGQNQELKNMKLSEKPVLRAKEFLEVKKGLDELGRNILDITLTKDGAKIFKEMTSKNIGKPIAIVLKRELVSAPTVMDEIAGGKVQISGNFSDEEIEMLVKSFKK